MDGPNYIGDHRFWGIIDAKSLTLLFIVFF